MLRGSGWSKLGDLRDIGNDRDAMRAAVPAAYSDAKPGAIPVWAGLLLRFTHEVKVGDVVVHPYKADSTLNFGRVDGDYDWEASASDDRHRRKVNG